MSTVMFITEAPSWQGGGGMCIRPKAGSGVYKFF